MAKGEHLVADRACAHYPGLACVAAKGGHVTARFNPRAIRLLDLSGKPFALKTKLHDLKQSQEGSVLGGASHRRTWENPIAGRLCVVRKSQTAITRARGKVKRTASRNGTNLQDETLFFAEYVMVLTTVPASALAAEDVLELYRLRWQIELLLQAFQTTGAAWASA